mgnify:CR=1 FL=1
MTDSDGDVEHELPLNGDGRVVVCMSERGGLFVIWGFLFLL